MASIDNIRTGQMFTPSARGSSRTELNQTSEHPKSERGSGNQDAVSLSSQGKALGKMHSELAAQPSFDKAKVAAIKEAILNGSYRVDAEKLADNMIKFEKELSHQ